jgi:hypothetical protein
MMFPYFRRIRTVCLAALVTSAFVVAACSSEDEADNTNVPGAPEDTSVSDVEEPEPDSNEPEPDTEETIEDTSGEMDTGGGGDATDESMDVSQDTGVADTRDQAGPCQPEGPTAARLAGGIVINEVFADPTATPGVDTDGNGMIEATDEFIEICNTSAEDIDISGYELWDPGSGKWFAFPGEADDGTTVLPGGEFATVVVAVQSGGSAPTMKHEGSISFDAARGSSVINNGGDNVVLYDPGSDELVQMRFSGDDTFDMTQLDSFSNSASRVGELEDWGDASEGASITRFPSGSTTVGVHPEITPGGAQASPAGDPQ